MRYATGQEMTVGDEVVADRIAGVIVCDFDNRQFLDGYESWDMPEVEMVGGGTLSAGVMIKTVEAGMIHYKIIDEDVQFVRAARAGGHD
jgi:hypothetical protein